MSPVLTFRTGLFFETISGASSVPRPPLMLHFQAKKIPVPVKTPGRKLMSRNSPT
jgi:hypothetical protein